MLVWAPCSGVFRKGLVRRAASFPRGPAVAGSVRWRGRVVGSGCVCGGVGCDKKKMAVRENAFFFFHSGRAKDDDKTNKKRKKLLTKEVPRELRLHHARVQRVRREPVAPGRRPGGPPRELVREEDVCQLGLPVGPPGGVRRLAEVEVGKVDLAKLVRARGHRDDPHGGFFGPFILHRGLQEQREQPPRQSGVPEVVDPELVLEAVGRLLARRERHDPRVVEEDVEGLPRVEDRGAEVPDGLKGREVEQGRVVVGQGDRGPRGGGGAHGGEGRLGLCGVPAAEDDVEAAAGRQLLGRDEADARVGSRDEDGLVFVAVLGGGGGLRPDDGRRRRAPGKNNRVGGWILSSSRFFLLFSFFLDAFDLLSYFSL